MCSHHIGVRSRVKNQEGVSSEEPAIEPPGAPYVRKLPRRSLTSDMVNELLSLIASGGFAHDRLPPERGLSRQLGVSRSALREALAVLDHVGAIETRGKSKYGRPALAVAQTIAADRSVEREFVSGPLEARRILEPEVAALAAIRASDDSLSAIRQGLRGMEDAVRRGKEGVDEDTAFHVAVARATENRTLELLVRVLSDSLHESRALSFGPREALETALQDHIRILEAIEAGDSHRARRAMERHLHHVESLILASLRDASRQAES